MDCKTVQEYIPAYIDRELNDDTAAQLDIHLSECDRCSSELQLQKGLHSLLADKLEKHRAPESLKTRIRQGIADAAVRPASLLQRKISVSFRPLTGLAVAAMLLIAALSGPVVNSNGLLSGDSDSDHIPVITVETAKVPHTIEIAEGVQATIVGQVVCIGCYLRDNYLLPYDVDKYGYQIGLLTSDGNLWTFAKSGESMKILEDKSFIGKMIKVDGQLFYNAHFIDVHTYQAMSSPE